MARVRGFCFLTWVRGRVSLKPDWVDVGRVGWTPLSTQFFFDEATGPRPTQADGTSPSMDRETRSDGRALANQDRPPCASTTHGPGRWIWSDGSLGKGTWDGREVQRKGRRMGDAWDPPARGRTPEKGKGTCLPSRFGSSDVLDGCETDEESTNRNNRIEDSNTPTSRLRPPVKTRLA